MWFFDCRDDGACRYQWENKLLEYFGADCTNSRESDFDKFHFETAKDNESEHYNQLWFQMTLFLEYNIRNAIAPLHYKLFDFSMRAVRIDSSGGMQEKAIALYNRQRSLLNTRARCPGLRNVTPGLSFLQKKTGGQNQNNVLKHCILSQLHDELPLLDPYLLEYIKQEIIPDVQLFLRMISCSNVLALRELAVQHKYLLGNERKPEDTPHGSLIQSTIRHFPANVQTEILYLLKKVQTDDSVFAITPVVHPSKQLEDAVVNAHGTQNARGAWTRNLVQDANADEVLHVYV
jgi:hypothetical protein